MLRGFIIGLFISVADAASQGEAYTMGALYLT